MTDYTDARGSWQTSIKEITEKVEILNSYVSDRSKIFNGEQKMVTVINEGIMAPYLNWETNEKRSGQ